ncbi:MAG: PQQ-binding-like beta-propeller repeat protein [Fuerstiella sp.]
MPTPLSRLAASLIFLSPCLQLCAFADTDLSWPTRNGPTSNGHVAAADSNSLPVEFSEDKGVAWKIKLPHFGHSTPVVGQGKIWLTAATEDGKQQFVLCIDEASGAILHEKLLFENEDPEILNNPVNTYASPTCVLTDDAVYVHFGTYGTARLNPETADVVWQRPDIQCRHFRGPGSSPCLFQDLLILTFDGIDAQFLMALNTSTGKTVWRTERSTDYEDLDSDGNPKREGDLRKAYSTPGLIEVDGTTQVVSMGSRAGYGYDALTGKEIWGIRHGEFNATAPPCFYQGMAIVNTGSRKAQLRAIKLDKTTTGDVTESHEIWRREKGNSRLSAPLLVDGLIYMVTDTGVVSCVNADDGKEVWKGRLGGTHVASPITANGLIYFYSEEGEVTVIKAADTFEIVSKNRLAEGGRASMSAANGHLFVRSFGHLYRIGGQ